MSTIEQWEAGKAIAGHPPWDGTGIPFPVDENGWPVIPGGGGGGDPVPVYPAMTIVPLAGVPTDVFTATMTIASSEGTPAGTTTLINNGDQTVVGGPSTQVGTFDLLIDATLLPVGLSTIIAQWVPDDDTVWGAGTTGVQIEIYPVAQAEEFDPAQHTVAEVQAYLAEHPDQTTYVLDRERAGKSRTSLIGD